MRCFSTLLVLACPALVQAQAVDNRLPPPESASIQMARKSVLEIFGPEIDKAKSVTARKDLSVRMLAAANDVKESSANRWVLYTLAREQAAAAGDVQFSMHAVNDFTKAFAVPRGETVADAVEKLAKVLPANASRPLLDVVQIESDPTIDADEYKSAVKILVIGLRVAQMGKDINITRRLEARLRYATDLDKAFDDVKGIDEHLGKFQCFRKGNWAKGLPLLLNTQDEALASIVKKDAVKPIVAKEQIELGDAWFELADKAKGEDRLGMLRRAFYWYSTGVGGTSGLVKAKAEVRIGKIINDVEEADAKDGRFSLLAGRWRINWANNHTYEMTISVLGRVDLNRDTAPDGSIKDPNTEGYEFLTRTHNRVAATKGEAFAVYKNGEIVDTYRLSAAALTLDRYEPGTGFPKKATLSGKVTPLR